MDATGRSTFDNKKIGKIMAFFFVTAAGVASPAPLNVELFMDWQNDLEDPWGLMYGKPTMLVVR